MDTDIPVCEKYVLSVQEASKYFSIGINHLRRIIREHNNAAWVLWNGTHAQIKRREFEKFIDSINSL